jgi:hypothetical protein
MSQDMDETEEGQPRPELGLGLDAVCFVILKARELDVQEGEGEEDEGSNPIDEDFRDVLEAHGDDPTFQELEAFIDGLDVDEKAELVALAWVGRGDFTLDEWAEAVRTAHSRHTGRTSRYLLGIPVLADYLEEGLAAFGLSCLENLPGDLGRSAAS